MRYFILILSLILTSTSLISAQEQTPYDIALERILEAEASGATELDLSELGLTDLPPQVWSLTNLENLNLFGNELETLSSEIGNLINLERLTLSGNELSSLPSEIGTLNSLIELSLSNNELNNLPTEIGTLNNLIWLSLNGNKLERLPSEISNLSNLCYLSLGVNPIQHLPTFLTQLERLEEDGCILNLRNNMLVSPPQEVIEQGTPAIFDYLNNRVWWHFQRLMPSLLSGLGVIVLVILGLCYRQRGQRKPKQKRGEA